MGRRADESTGTSESAGHELSIFEPGVFYKIETEGGREYYALLEAVGLEHYWLKKIFYRETRAAVASDSSATTSADGLSSDGITLIKYGTEPDQPADELLIPREKVVSITPLAEDSPVLKAIVGYQNK